jgi:hypothetical protein
MKRMRLSTLMLLIVIAALSIALVVREWRDARQRSLLEMQQALMNARIMEPPSTRAVRETAVSNELVKASPVSVPALITPASLPELVERAGGAARFAWDEFFYAEHHNPHRQKAYLRAVRRFLGWAERQGVELASITPGMVARTWSAWAGRLPSVTSTWRRYAVSSTGWSTGTSASSTQRRRCVASKIR